MKKYEILMDKKNTIEYKGRALHRIKALRDFRNVKKGDVGGYIESETNLSHEGNCWIFDNAKVYDNAMVSGKAKVFDNASVYGNAEVYGNSSVFEDAEVFCNAVVFGDGLVVMIFSEVLLVLTLEIYRVTMVSFVIFSLFIGTWSITILSFSSDSISFIM